MLGSSTPTSIVIEHPYFLGLTSLHEGHEGVELAQCAMGAAAELEKEGISAEVIDLRSIRPLDWKTLVESVKKTNRMIIVEEQWPMCSVSSEIAYRIQKEAFDYLDAPILRITSADAPMHYAPNLAALAIPDVARTVKLVKQVMYLKK